MTTKLSLLVGRDGLAFHPVEHVAKEREHVLGDALQIAGLDAPHAAAFHLLEEGTGLDGAPVPTSFAAGVPGPDHGRLLLWKAEERTFPVERVASPLCSLLGKRWYRRTGAGTTTATRRRTEVRRTSHRSRLTVHRFIAKAKTPTA